MKPHLFSRCILRVLAIGIIAASAQAEMRWPVEDPDLVARSELIVIGGIKEGSIVYVPHKVGPEEGRSWEHHAVLVIHQVLKGKCESEEIPITIHYGLDPLIDGHMKHEGIEVGRPTTGPAPGKIQIFDSGNSVMSWPDPSQDARQDNLWFLQRRSGKFGREVGHGDYGIADPEEFQPLTLKNYFLCYLSDDPESAVRKYMQAKPAVAERAMRYLDHVQKERVKGIGDPAERAERLIPYFMNRSTTDEAGKTLVAIGAPAGPYLLGVYKRTYDRNLRDQIIRMWGAMGWRDCSDLLIDLLKKTDEYWARQKLEAGWWNRDVSSAVTSERREQYGLVYSSVWALRQFRQAKAREAIELTRKRWAAINFENKQIVEECDAALKELAEARTAAEVKAVHP
jgi:hypothetical protein